MTTPSEPPEGQGPQPPGTPEDALAGQPAGGPDEVAGSDNTPPGGVQLGEVEVAGPDGGNAAGNGWGHAGEVTGNGQPLAAPPSQLPAPTEWRPSEWQPEQWQPTTGPVPLLLPPCPSRHRRERGRPDRCRWQVATANRLLRRMPAVATVGATALSPERYRPRATNPSWRCSLATRQEGRGRSGCAAGCSSSLPPFGGCCSGTRFPLTRCSLSTTGWSDLEFQVVAGCPFRAELVREVHYIICEHWGAYNHFWRTGFSPPIAPKAA